MNKKKLMLFGVLGLFALALVSAGLIVYYGQSTHKLDVKSPVSFIGDAIYPVVEVDYAGQVLEGNELGMTNNADFEVLMQISDDTPEGIETTYKGDLKLTKKTVDFTKDVWDVLGEKVQIEYTVVGDEFNAEVVSPISDYVLIYYKDNSDRFNEPAEAILVEGNSFPYLPYKTDRNSVKDGTYNYCDTLEYNTCHGAKIWYVPSTAILTGGVLDWSQASNFYFESSLIQYNAEGQITVYPGETLDFTPEFDVSLLFEGTADITTSVAPIVA